MAGADLLVAKPGPGTLAEALALGLPVLVTRNRHTIPQERFNAEFIEQGGLGGVARHWRELPGMVADLRARPLALPAIRERIAALPANRAVYEVVDLLDEVVKTA